jgi:hypothetical protein
MTDVIRYVVTYVDLKYGRTLVGPIQGRNTYATPEAALHQLQAMLKNNSPKTLAETFPGELQVRACPCWPVHFDPKQIYFKD